MNEKTAAPLGASSTMIATLRERVQRLLKSPMPLPQFVALGTMLGGALGQINLLEQEQRRLRGELARMSMAIGRIESALRAAGPAPAATPPPTSVTSDAAPPIVETLPIEVPTAALPKEPVYVPVNKKRGRATNGTVPSPAPAVAEPGGTPSAPTKEAP